MAATASTRLAAARAAAAATYVARHAAAVLAAQSRFDATRAALAGAHLTYSSAQADYERAASRADLLRALRDKARTTSDASRRALAMSIRGLLREHGNAGFPPLFDEAPGAGLLVRLDTLDTLSRLAENLVPLRERVAADIAREEQLTVQATAAQAAVERIPLAEARAELAVAQAEDDAASAAVADLAPTALTVSSLTPLSEATADTERLSAQGWARPAYGRITDPFGPRPVHPVAGVGDFHHGTDVGSACDAAVYAASDGVVEAAGVLGSYGNWILIGHGDGIETGYAHIADGETLVAVGEPVVAGQVIAGVGATGATTGCHLHFEVRVDGTAVDAVPFLTQRGVLLGR